MLGALVSVSVLQPLELEDVGGDVRLGSVEPLDTTGFSWIMGDYHYALQNRVGTLECQPISLRECCLVCMRG